jgi:uncharacterized protein involved in exopolysaccharide biosynthesis
MEENPVVKYKQNTGAVAPFRRGAIPPFGEGGFQLNVRDALSVIFKHKYMILGFFVVAVLLAPVAYYVVPRFRPVLFESKAVLMLKSGREYNDPELSTKKTPISFGRGEIFTSEMMLLRSRDLKQRVISTIGLDKIYPDVVAHPSEGLPPLESALITFDKNLLVSEVRNSNFIEVSFLNADPDVAAKVTNLLIDYYMEKRREVLSDPKAVFFTQKKLAEYRQKLREVEENLEAFRKNYGFYSFDKQMDFLLKKRSQLEDAIAQAQEDAQSLKSTLMIVASQAKAAPEANSSLLLDEGTGNPRTDVGNARTEESKALRTRLRDLQAKEMELLEKYKEQSWYVVSTRDEIKQVQDLIEKEEAPLRNAKPAVRAQQKSFASQGMDLEKSVVEGNVSAAEKKIADLREELAACQKQIADLAPQEKKLSELQREKEHNEQYYKIYETKMEDLRISEDIGRQDMPSISVVQAAIPSVKPVNKSLNLLFFFAVAVAVGLGGGVGFAYLMEFMSEGLRTPENVASHLGLPVLVVVPYKG